MANPELPHAGELFTEPDLGLFGYIGLVAEANVQGADVSMSDKSNTETDIPPQATGTAIE